MLMLHVTYLHSSSSKSSPVKYSFKIFVAIWTIR